MKDLTHGIRIAGLFVIALVLAGCGGGGGYDIPPDTVIPTTIVPPLPLPGPNTVACSNVAQDFSRLAPGEDVKDYWEGCPSTSGGRARYATDLLADPANTLSRHGDAHRTTRNLYGSFAGKHDRFVVIACYPTVADNPRPDYPLPTGQSRAAHADRRRAAAVRGRRGPLSGARVFARLRRQPALRTTTLPRCPGSRATAMSWWPRFMATRAFPTVRIDDFDDAVMVLSHLGDFTALQAIAAVVDVGRARPRARASAMARPRRCNADRRLRGEHGRRDADADGRRRIHRRPPDCRRPRLPSIRD